MRPPECFLSVHPSIHLPRPPPLGPPSPPPPTVTWHQYNNPQDGSWSHAWRRSTGQAGTTAAVDVVETVDGVLVDRTVYRAGGGGVDRTWGRPMAAAQGCDWVTPPGGTRGGALCAGLVPQLPRQAGGGATGTVVRQGRANRMCGCGQRQARAKQVAGHQVLCALRLAALATAVCEMRLSGSGEAWGRGGPPRHCPA